MFCWVFHDILWKFHDVLHVFHDVSCVLHNVLCLKMFCECLMMFCDCLMMFCECLMMFCECLTMFCEWLMMFCECLTMFCECLMMFCECLMMFWESVVGVAPIAASATAGSPISASVTMRFLSPWQLWIAQLYWSCHFPVLNSVLTGVSINSGFSDMAQSGHWGQEMETLLPIIGVKD